MPDLSRDQRRALDTAMNSAREAAEAGAADALRRLGVADANPPAHLDKPRRALRRQLQEHALGLGDKRDPDGTQAIAHLTEAAAYIQWHRLLFARFLLERHLLRDADNDLVSLADCRDEALRTGGGDEWAIAAAHTARMLPGVFPADDSAEAVTLAPEHAKALRDQLRALPQEVFLADDSLGWTYQFWRSAEKKRVNESQVKIGAVELPAVTQLFTEPYMVRFLLHNTLGAWWAGKVLTADAPLARDAASEDALRAACALPGYAWDYLRFVKDGETWRPAAGSFTGWPHNAANLTVLDPCCGSGHFLTEALSALVALRAHEEGLTPAHAVAAVLRDNLAGLEIDGRCVQIASFALALTAWRIGGPQTLPNPNVAWVGAPPPLPKEQFVALADGDVELRRGLAALHSLFERAPLLGSLIEPTGGDLIDPVRVARIEDSIAKLVERMRDAEPEQAEGAIAARGMADAAAILAKRWVLQATNVPFRSTGTLDDELRQIIDTQFDRGRRNLATTMLVRMVRMSAESGSIACVTPKEWLSARSFQPLREWFVSRSAIDLIGSLGPRAFQTITGEVVNAALVVVSAGGTSARRDFALVDATLAEGPVQKAGALRADVVSTLSYHTVALRAGLELADIGADSWRLSDYTSHHQGLATGDLNRFSAFWWEVDIESSRWIYWQGTVDCCKLFSGCERALLWGHGNGDLHAFNEENKAIRKNTHLRGSNILGFRGVLVTQMGQLPATLYSGERFDDSTTVLIPKDEINLAAVWCFITSSVYSEAVRKIDSSIKVPAATLAKVPLDLAHWQQIATEKYPNGLPEPYSDDPTQWLFHGHPYHATPGTELHVALARIAGYRWPAETDTTMRLSPEARALIAEAVALPPADPDGLLPLPPLLSQRGLAERLRTFCLAAWGADWQPGTEAALITAACERARDNPPRQLTLEAWLASHAARQHAKLFHDRPFLWWITDGRADGFTIVANYHRLTRDNLERLTYQLLGDWLARLGEDPRAEAARILQAKLALIIEGAKPYDIFVRWKTLARQPLGWDPDLDDGVRQNIRPFLKAGVLAYAPTILKDVDRGTDASSAPWHHKFNGVRRNDHHTTLAEKRAARGGA